MILTHIFFTLWMVSAYLVDFGEVTVAYPLDYEDDTIPKSWVLYVRAYDNERTHSTTGTLTVILQDVNDNHPRCSQDIYV